MKFTHLDMLEFVVIMINNTPQEIYDYLKTVRNPVQFIDSRVDADALCSAFSLYHILKKHFGIELTICYEKNISKRYYEQLENFIEIPKIIENTNPNSYDFSKHDCLICTDSGSIYHLSSTSDFEKPQNIKVINIDHHEGNKGYGDYNYVKELGSACSVVYELLKKWEIKPNVQVANALLIGITLDTGFYNYNSTTALDFYYSGELIDLGAKHYDITWQLTFNENEADQKVRKIVFSNLVIDKKNKIAYTTITLDELRRNDLNLADSFLSPSDLIKKIQGIEFAFSVKEMENEINLFNISLRSHTEKYNSLELARKLDPNSGGHIMAAGAIIKADNIDSAVRLVIDTATNTKYQENS